jgi:hypothetical protein
MFPAIWASPCICVMTSACGGPNWFAKSAVASTLSNVTPFPAGGRVFPPPPAAPASQPPQDVSSEAGESLTYFKRKIWLLAIDLVPQYCRTTREWTLACCQFFLILLLTA